MAEFIENISTSLQKFTVLYAIDILLVTGIIYGLIRITSRTRARQVLKGLGILIVLAQLFSMLRLPTISWLLNQIVTAGAVLLVILGYSINDTIVIYDRIRENERLHAGRLNENSIKDMVNLSINQTLSRTVNTSVATLIAMVVVCILAFANGVSSIVEFAFPLIIGLISGAYSSICLSGPIWVSWQQRKMRNKRKQSKSANA